MGKTMDYKETYLRGRIRSFLTTEPRAEVDNSNKADPSIPVV